jgi:hypothetical protein
MPLVEHLNRAYPGAKLRASTERWISSSAEGAITDRDERTMCERLGHAAEPRNGGIQLVVPSYLQSTRRVLKNIPPIDRGYGLDRGYGRVQSIMWKLAGGAIRKGLGQ